MTARQNASLKAQQNIRFLILSVTVLALLQVAILTVLLLRDSGLVGVAIDRPAANCARGFGFNPKVPRSPDIDCQAAPVNISARA